MSALPAWASPGRAFGKIAEGDGEARHGVQLALAVVIAYSASWALRLPEGFWAVMSALIVVRPNTGATLDAGWDRVRGTVLGTAFGLGGVGLRHLGLGLPEATLGVVAVLAFASGVVPGWRSAPITALIVVSGSGIAGHSAWGVAGLRVTEIAIGIAAGLGVTLLAPASRAALRFDRECAALLRLLAVQVGASLSSEVAPADAGADASSPRESPAVPAAKMPMRRVSANDDAEAAQLALRAALRRLIVLAEDADRESRLFRRRGAHAATSAPRHRSLARLMQRTAQDAGALGRVVAASPQHRSHAICAEVGEVAAQALSDVADVIAGSATPDLSELRHIARRLGQADGHTTPRAPEIQDVHTPPADNPGRWLAGPVKLLADDLGALVRLTGRHAPGQTPPISPPR